MSLNQVHLIGNLGADPELRFTANGTAMTTFRLAVTYGFGEKQTTEWVSVVTWEKLAERVNQYLTKGSKAYVEGRLQTRSWDDKDGQKRYRTEVVANDVQFLDRKAAEAGVAVQDDLDGDELPPF